MNSDIKYTCAILVLGNLGEPATISLSSLENIDSISVCVLSDDAGRAWIRQNSTDKIKSKLCFHSTKEIENIISNLDHDIDYVSFGNPRFFKLMILKWLLILDSFKMHKNIHSCIYTDLDVYWRKSPREVIGKLFEKEISLLIQDDSTLDGSRQFYCPGIMIWKNSTESKNIIKEVFEIQKKEIDSGVPFPDDKALNYWINQNENRKKIKGLPTDLFIIGHRILWLLIGIRGFSLKKTVAFHGNYSVGIKEKTKLMEAASLSHLSFKRIYFAVDFILRKYVRFL